MPTCKHIAIIAANSLQSIGIYYLLLDYFSPVNVKIFNTFPSFNNTGNDSFDFYITTAETYVLYEDFFLPRKIKTIVLTEKQELQGAVTNFLTTNAPQEDIIDQQKQILISESNTQVDACKELSSRETDVLQLVVKGITNKEIAERLNISLNTVLSHRKNITSKLGIKTVSGLTFYAIMNGVISGEEFGM